jgi:hypothetical protein
MMFGTPGATGVWAPENTRTAIFDAIRSKETFGTSGPLIRLRFFGGWEYPADMTKDPDFVKKAYAGGVPMGGDLPARVGKDLAKAPAFAVWALAWEKVYDVAWSDNRKADPKTGKLPPVGNTVDIKTATYTNDIGATQLSVVWTDPDFDPALHAVYYVRVLEIPTPRWTTYDAAALGIEPPAEVPATLQERAWSSPIWYTPDPELVRKPSFYPGLRQFLPE